MIFFKVWEGHCAILSSLVLKCYINVGADSTNLQKGDLYHIYKVFFKGSSAKIVTLYWQPDLRFIFPEERQKIKNF